MKRATSRRGFLKAAGLWSVGCVTRPLAAASVGKTSGRPPNFVVIFCDDLGYGDLACFGSKTHRTPNLDRMAAEGTRFTSFYVTSGVCSPSRASLMTGCYPRRVNLHKDAKNGWVLFPCARKGLNPQEITIAEILKARGYATTCVGKWHLGDQPEFLPTRQGFDSYFGLPYSNDMQVKGRGDPPLPLLRNETVVEAPVDQTTLTRRYTEETVAFIAANRDRPFFVYLPHSMVHNPVHASEAFRGKSANGGYGDAVEEVDWSTGKILDTLVSLGIAGNTLVLFTSDNGAASRWGGSNAPLAGWKGSTMEGGMRVPCIAWWPGHVAPGRSCDQMAITMDLLPTFARLAGTEPPADRTIDGKDIWPLLSGRPGARTPHQAFYYYHREQLQAVRSGRWKLHLPRTRKGKNGAKPTQIGVKLVDLTTDIKEEKDLAAGHPDVVQRLLELANRARADLGDGAVQGADQRAAGMVVTPVPLLMPGSTWEPHPSRFELKQGQSLSSASSPRVAGKPFTLAATFDAGEDGVIIAQGGLAYGYVLYIEKGRPCFAVRTSREDIATIAAPAALPEGRVGVEAKLGRDGSMSLSVGGRRVAVGRAKRLIPNHPAEALQVGADPDMAVGTYQAPNAFAGGIESVVVRVGD